MSMVDSELQLHRQCEQFGTVSMKCRKERESYIWKRGRLLQRLWCQSFSRYGCFYGVSKESNLRRSCRWEMLMNYQRFCEAQKSMLTAKSISQLNIGQPKDKESSQFCSFGTGETAIVFSLDCFTFTFFEAQDESEGRETIPLGFTEEKESI